MIDDFKQWIAELRRLAAEDGAPDYVGEGASEEDWMAAFEDGYHSGATPLEAWTDEKSYAAADAA